MCWLFRWHNSFIHSNDFFRIKILKETHFGGIQQALLVPPLMAQMVKHLPTRRETRVQSLGWEDPLEKEMATHSSVLAWRIPWMEEPGGLQSMGSQRVGHDWATNTFRRFLQLLEFRRHCYVGLDKSKRTEVYVRRNNNFWKIICMLRQNRPSNISQVTYVLDQQ